MPEIAIIIPVLGRPQRAQIVADSIFAAKAVSTDVVFVCTPGDTEQISACVATGERVLTTSWTGGRGDYARKINLGFEETDAPFVFTGADDLVFTDGWDLLVLAEAAKGGNLGVVGTIDLCNPRTAQANHSTHSLVSRRYADEFGTIDGTGILHPGYWHNFCDDELVETARARRRYRPSAAVVRHMHPMRSLAPTDDTYKLGAAHFHEDRQRFRKRRQLWAKGKARTHR